MSRKLIGMALGALACVALAAGTADAQEKCKGAKQKAAGKAAGGALKCEAKGDSKGLDSATIDACEVKPDGALGTAYTKADTKFAPGCAGTASATAAAIETCEDNANNAVMNAGSPRTASKCDGKIVAAISKKVGGLLGCDAKATAKGLDPSACEMAVKTKFTAAMGKLGSATDCSIHPGTGITGADTTALENVADNCQSAINGTLAGGGTTTTTTLPSGACTPIVTGQNISNTYQITSVAGGFLCTQNSTTAGKAFNPCSSAADVSCGGAGNCAKLPWVTLGSINQPTPVGATTKITVTEGASPACEHSTCVKCGGLVTCPGLPSCTTSNCNGHLSNQCCSQPGFQLPALFITAVNACTRLDQNGSGAGVVNSSNPQTGHNVIKKSGDTSDPGADCVYGAGDPVTNCATADGDTKGLVFRTVGLNACKTGVPPTGSQCPNDAQGIHLRVSTPGLSTTWSTTMSDCMTNGTFHSGSVLTQIQLNAEPSTAGTVGEFADHNGDSCALGTFGSQGFSASNPAGPISTVGTMGQSPIPYGGSGLRNAAAGIAFSSVNGEGDIGFVSVTDNSGPTVVSASTCDSPAINPPVGCPEQ